MKIESGDNFVLLDVSVEEDGSLPSYGDARISISLHSYGFCGESVFWVESAGFREFCSALVNLERERLGEAVLNSMSPREMNLRIYSTNSLGHLAISGTIFRAVGDIPHCVTFGFEFDSEQLVNSIASPWVKQNAA